MPLQIEYLTRHFAFPLLIRNKNGLVAEITDGTAEYNEKNNRLSLFYDLAKMSVVRMAKSLAHKHLPYQCTAVA
ncbi:hypothetical protein APP_02440 [Aeribacillus pallidus]|nr:hypothetical protein APP_02440 [Aeribacillus pallidus]